MSALPFAPTFAPSGTGVSSTGAPSERLRSAGPSETTRQGRYPSPPPVAGRKRVMRAASAHTFENGKLPKLHFYDHVVPLKLNPLGEVPQPPLPGAGEGVPPPRPIAPMPTRPPGAASHSAAPPHVQGWNGGGPNAASSYGPMRAQEAPNAGLRDPRYQQSSGMQGIPAAQSQPDAYGNFSRPYGQGPNGGQPYAPASTQPGPSQFSQPYTGVQYAPPSAQHVPQQFSQAYAAPRAAPPSQAETGPYGYPAGYAPAYAPHPPSQSHVDESRYTGAYIPHGNGHVSWEQHSFPQRPEFVPEAQHRQGWQDGAFSHVVDTNMAGGREDTTMAADDGMTAPDSGLRDKGKGKATNWAQATVEDDDEGDTPSPRAGLSSTPDVNNMTNSFGVMLLDHVQQANEQINKKMSEFMTQQTAAQERLRHTVAHEVRAVHAKVAQLQNPLPLHGHRRSGKFDPASPLTASPPSQRSPASGKTPKSPATPKRVRADRTKPAMGANTEGILSTVKASVRTHLKKMLDFTTWDELASRHPPFTEEELKAFRTGKKSVTCTEETFRIDFVQEWKRFPVNLAARDFFVQNLLTCIKGGGFDFAPSVVPCVTEEHVQWALDMHMEYCRKKYRDAYNRQGWDSADEEDAKAIAMQNAKDEKVKKRKALNSRKKTLFDSRLCVVLEKDLTRHALLFDRLLPQNMSGDETDGPQRKLPMTYRIVEARWQSVAFKTFMRALDTLYRENWEKTSPGKRATGGNAPRTRVSRPDGRVEDGYAPVGLWRNCYDRVWLRSLQPYERRALKVINADYDFDMTPDPAEAEEEIGDDDAVDADKPEDGDDDADADADAEGETDTDA